MKKYLLLPFLLLCSVITIHAQNNFIDGFIITNTNDTINGWIDYRTDKMNGKVCKFKPDVNAEVQIYHPGEITGFRFTGAGKFYVSKTVKLRGVQSNLFLEYLLQGVMNLYYYQEDDSDYSNFYFFENDKGEMISITKGKEEILKNEEGNWVQKDDIKYKGVINYLFRDYESISKEAFNTKFIHKDMIGLAKEYHKLVCTSGESCIEFETKVDKHIFKTNYTVYGGVDYSTYFPRYYTANTELSQKSFSPMIGGQFNISVPRLFKSISLVVDLSLTKQHSESTESYSGTGQRLFVRAKVNDVFQSSETSREVDYLKYSYDAIKIAGGLGVKYTYSQWKVKPVVEAGLDFYYPLNEKQTYDMNELAYNSLPEKRTVYNWKGSKSVLTGYYAALGIDYSLNEKHSIILRVNSEHRKDMNAWQMKLGYTF